MPIDQKFTPMKTHRKLKYIALFPVLLFFCACSPQESQNSPVKTDDWKTEFDHLLPLLGHRNWILVVDKAFPMQNSPGITILNTGEKLLPALQFVISRLNESTHVKPVFYNDAELKFLVPDQVPGLAAFRESAGKTLGRVELQPILHDSVFVKIDAASKLFKVVVLKTEETIPYSSVFIELGCKYWNQENETELRKRMKEEKP
jgi:hypothetical protein